MRDERGAVVPMVAIFLTLLLSMTALTVDLGRQRVARTDMQSLADMVALDMTRLLDGRTAAQITSAASWTTTRDQSVARNSTTTGSTPVVSAEVGTVDSSSGAFTVASGTTVPSAVRVTASTSVTFGFTPGTGSATRTAVAVTDSSACYQVGSYAAAVRSGNGSLLGPLLGAFNSNLNLTAASASGLATSSVTLADLATELGAGSVDALATSSVTYRNVYLALATLLTRQGKTAQASILSAVAASISATATVPVSNLLSLGLGTNAAAQGQANVLDLVSAAAFLMNGTNALSLPLGASLPGLTTTTASVNLVQKVQHYCGKPGSLGSTATPASTSQGSASLSSTLTTAPVVIPLVGTVSAGSPTGQPIAFSLNAAPTSASLQQVTCSTPASSTQGITLSMTNGLATTSLSVPLRVTGNVTLAGLVGLVSVDIRTTVTASSSVSASGPTPFTISVPPRAFDTVYSTGSGSVTLSSTTAKTGTTVTATLLGLPVTLSTAQIDSILNPVISSVVQPLITALNSALVTPLLDLLGARVGGADVIADSVPALSCTVPALRG